MKTRYSTPCRECGKGVSTKASESAGAVRIRCGRCGATNHAGGVSNKNQAGVEP